MGDDVNELSFEFLDDVAFAAARKRVDPAAHLSAAQVTNLGPFLELLVLQRSNRLPPDTFPAGPACQVLRQATSSHHAGRGSYYLTTEGARVGFVTTAKASQAEDRVEWIAFCRKAQEAAELSLPKPAASGMIGAMRELEDNVHLHSERSQDGVVGFHGTADEFEFVVADGGIGVLQSLRQSPDYQHLDDAGTAIKIALTDGQSRLRYLDPGRGHGFHDLFIGLANLNGKLRFRSDDHALTINGASPTLVTAHLSQKVPLQGFVASVVCSVKPTSTRH
jgi:hypothetical protein